MKKMRDKKFGLARQTIRELTPEDKAALARVVGGSCAPMAPSTHCTAMCVDEPAP